ncbi:MAG: exosome complex RNA-binding protein Csl4 [archaeon]
MSDGKKTVVPGELLGNSVEYLPGFGTYAKDDDVLSSNIGEPVLDAKNHLARLNVRTRVAKLQGVGTITLGKVAEVTENSAMVDLMPVRVNGVDYAVNGITAVLRVSDVKNSYVETMHSEFRVGDIIKARITGVSKHTVSLSTDGKSLGVVKASCARCRTTLERDGVKLRCPACGFIESRKLADCYGSDFSNADEKLLM